MSETAVACCVPRSEEVRYLLSEDARESTTREGEEGGVDMPPSSSVRDALRDLLSIASDSARTPPPIAAPACERFSISEDNRTRKACFSVPRTRHFQIKRTYWTAVKSLKDSKESFLSNVVRDARDSPIPADVGIRNEYASVESFCVAIASTGALLAASSSSLRLATLLLALAVVVGRLAIVRRKSATSAIEDARATLSIAIAETSATHGALRRSLALVGTCELVARGYRPGRQSLRVVSKLESIKTLRCLPLRRAILSASTRAAREIRSATRAIRELSTPPSSISTATKESEGSVFFEDRDDASFSSKDRNDVSSFSKDGVSSSLPSKDDDSVSSSSSSKDQHNAAAITSASLRDRLRAVRGAAGVFWYELLVCLERGSTGDTTIRDESAWIANVASIVSDRYVASLRPLREALERENSTTPSLASPSEMTTLRRLPRTSVAEAALAHVSRELRSSLEIVSARGVLCHQQLIERLRVVADRDGRAETDAKDHALVDVVLEARRAVEESVRRTESLWTSMESLAASIDRRDGDNALRRPPARRQYAATSSSRESAPDGTWHEAKTTELEDVAQEASSDPSGIVDVFVGGNDVEEEEEEEDGTDDERGATRFVLSASVLGDLKSALVRKSQTEEQPTRTRRVPVAESPESDVDAWEIVPPRGVSLVRELECVLESRRREAGSK